MKTLVLFGLFLSLSSQAREAKTFAGLPKGFPILLGEPLLFVDGADAVQGNEFNLFIRPTTDYAGSYVVLDATLDGNPVNLEHPVGDLWIFNAPQFEMLKKHTLQFSVSLENSSQADQFTQALCSLGAEILDLQTQIANTSDSNQLADLEALLAQKQALQTQLTNDLIGLKNPIGAQDFSFSVGAAPSDSTLFPRIASVSPNVGSVAGGTAISISGMNFVDGATVSIGGAPATNVVFVSATSITAISPVLTSGGIKDVVVTLPLGTGDVEQKQALLANGFFATSTFRSAASAKMSSKFLNGSIFHGGPGFEHDHACSGRAE